MITGRKMTDEMAAVIRQRFPYTKTAALARELGVSYRTVCRWAADMGITKTEDFRQGVSGIATRHRKDRYGSRKGKPRTLLDEGVAAWMRLHYATTPDKEVARLFGVNDRTVRRWAARLGLRKDHDYIVMERRVQFSPTPEERFRTVCIIRELFPDGRDEEAEELTGYTIGYIRQLAKRHGIKRSDEYIMAIEGKRKSGHERYMRKIAERYAGFEELYMTTDTHTLAERYGISRQRIYNMASEKGIRKRGSSQKSLNGQIVNKS